MENRRQSGLWNQDPQTGFYEQQPPNHSGPYKYYEPPARPQDKRRSFSERAAGTQPATYQPKSSAQPALRIDPDAPPANLRSKPWSPDPNSPQQQRPAGLASEGVRRGSVPDRGPLQKLEMQASKEQKRARAEEAELRARQKSSGLTLLPSAHAGDARALDRRRSEVARAGGGEGARQPEEGKRRGEESGDPAVAGAAAAPQAENGMQRFRRASEALRKETSPGVELLAAKRKQGASAAPESRPLHQAGAAARDAGGAQYLPSGRERREQDQPGNNVELGRTPKNNVEPGRTQGNNVELGRTQSNNADLGRTQSGNYKHRARDAGFAGAAAAVAGGGGAAERGKMAYERRKGQKQQSPQASPTASSPRYYGPGGGGHVDQPPQAEPVSPERQEGGLGRSVSKKLQKRRPPPAEWNGRDRSNSQASDDQQRMEEPQVARQALQTERMGGGGKNDLKAAIAFQDPDLIPPARAAAGPDDAVNYKIPPQTAGGQAAREQVGLGTDNASSHAAQQDKHHRFGGMFHHHGQEHRSYQPGGRPLEEWRNAGIAKLTLEDLEFEGHATAGATDPNSKSGAPWWEKGGRRTSSGGSATKPVSAQYDGAYEEQAQHFRPELYLKCGPLLRYTGMRREAAQPSRGGRATGGEREVWRGSVMIVTDDRQSDFSSVPTLRIFAQPMDLHTPPPAHLLESGQELPPEFEDPVAGQVKLSRTGRPLYVRPVHDLDGGVDLSRVENPQGLYASTRTPTLGPQSISGPDGRQSQHITFQDKSRIKRHSGEQSGRVREVRAHRLHVERECTFWRFNVEIELGSTQHRVAYRINKGPALGFWVPARGQTMNTMFHSCNGFSLAVDANAFSGPDPLWRDVLNQHQSRPFHVMLGGGDQIYNDAAVRDTTLFRQWLATKNPEHKHKADFTPEMQAELESFYLERYTMWFSQGLFAMANSQIPMVNIWDDHDIIDGFGSYPHHFMSSRVFTGLGAVAFKYYMLFQHHSVAAETEREEPSWLLGAAPGPYIHERSRSVCVSLGRKVTLVGLDCRTERMRDEVLSQETYDLVFDRCRAEIVEGETRHLIVLLGVPIAYPRLNFLENILTSKVMDPIKALGRTGLLGGFVNKFDGGVEILDDLDDHWTAKHHKAERNWFVQELQELAAEKSVRVTILGGDVHLGAVGRFYSAARLGVAKDRDHRYMANVVSSAIVNTPPPTAMADLLNRRNRVHRLDAETEEDLIPMFERDVDGRGRNNRTLLPRRNFCTIREFVPSGETPAGSPGGADGRGVEGEGVGRRGGGFPPGSMKRTMSLTRGPMGLVRRLSGSGKAKNPPTPLAPEHARPYSAQGKGAAPPMQRSSSVAGTTDSGSYFPPGETAGAGARPSGLFQRRVTGLSVRGAKRGGGRAEASRVDLEGGLDVCLNMEVDQRDPSGATVPYRLLVPALWYEGEGDANTAQVKGRSGGFLGRLRGRGKSGGREEEGGEYSRSPSPSPPPSRRLMASQQHMRGEGDGGYDDDGFAASGKRAERDYSGGQLDGATGGWRAANGQQHPQQQQPASRQPSANAYKKGYRSSSPPGGLTPPQQQQQQPQPSRNAPASRNTAFFTQQTAAYRHSSAPARDTHHAANEPWRGGQAEEGSSSEGSVTTSPEEGVNGYGQRPAVQPRRLSKAERFFGIGDEGGVWGGDGGGGGRRPSVVQRDGSYEGAGEGKRKGGWRIWK
ncbi:hypothetical protein LTR08_005356 [Meristemomyces frigidus]|nr:hypothetical protein LTR08_005356 [Meristemomyces frigidus]